MRRAETSLPLYLHRHRTYLDHRSVVSLAPSPEGDEGVQADFVTMQPHDHILPSLLSQTGLLRTSLPHAVHEHGWLP